MCFNERWEDKTPAQQNQGIDGRLFIMDAMQDWDIGSDASKAVIMKSSQDSGNGKIRTMSV